MSEQPDFLQNQQIHSDLVLARVLRNHVLVRVSRVPERLNQQNHLPLIQFPLWTLQDQLAQDIVSLSLRIDPLMDDMAAKLVNKISFLSTSVIKVAF